MDLTGEPFHFSGVESSEPYPLIAKRIPAGHPITLTQTHQRVLEPSPHMDPLVLDFGETQQFPCSYPLVSLGPTAPTLRHATFPNASGRCVGIGTLSGASVGIEQSQRAPVRDHQIGSLPATTTATTMTTTRTWHYMIK